MGVSFVGALPFLGCIPLVLTSEDKDDITYRACTVTPDLFLATGIISLTLAVPLAVYLVGHERGSSGSVVAPIVGAAAGLGFTWAMDEGSHLTTGGYVLVGLGSLLIEAAVTIGLLELTHETTTPVAARIGVVDSGARVEVVITL